MGSFDFDAYAPAEIARRVEAVGVAKARLPLLPLLIPGLLAFDDAADQAAQRLARALRSDTPLSQLASPKEARA
jgi:hypothetical protein